LNSFCGNRKKRHAKFKSDSFYNCISYGKTASVV
jgi:hypothetical protein